MEEFQLKKMILSIPILALLLSGCSTKTEIQLYKTNVSEIDTVRGKATPESEVTFTHGQKKITTTANSNGKFYETNLKPGIYTVTASLNGKASKSLKLHVKKDKAISQYEDKEESSTWASIEKESSNETESSSQSSTSKSSTDESLTSSSSDTDSSATKESSSSSSTATTKVSSEDKAALNKAEAYASRMDMSKQGVYEQLTSSAGEGFSSEAAQYAVNHLTDVDWNANALAKAKDYQSKMSMSHSAILDQLTSSAGEQFTQSQAQYAIDHLPK